MSLTRQEHYDRQVAAWLLLCAAVIFGMILLGGVTRLTNSGLSMVEWRPLMGVVPPLTDHAWQETFDKYKQFPEYQKINRGMSLAEFRYIFMYEYLHRVLGRVIGLLYFLPMMFFLASGRVRKGLAPRLWLLFAMGGFQGLLGWYMVKSGLVDNPRVSQYRLTAHLGVAVAIYAYMLWLAFSLLMPSRPAAGGGVNGLGRWSLGVVGMVYLMILSGGLVAGTDAGFSYSTWPLMGPTFVPEAVYAGTPAWLDAFEDVTTIQFNHRIFAYLLFVLIHVFGFVVYREVRDSSTRLAVALLLAALWIQVSLGISTLLLHVPVPLAAAHQGGAVALLSAALFLSFLLKRRQAAPA
jgi:cytochrome c oxidase assembly protein subunit 15